MGVTLKDGKLTIGGVYGLTVNRGDFSSEKASQSFAIEYALDDGVDTAAAIAEAEAIYDGAINAVKIAVFSHLGIEAQTDENGVLGPKLPQPPPVAAVAAAPQQLPNPYGGGGGGGGGQPPYKPKADLTNEPRFMADLGDGAGPTQWIDLRGVKARGDFKPGSADFRDATNSKHQVWLHNKDGSVKQSVATALQAAGVPV